MTTSIMDFFQHLTDPDWIMNNGGLILVLIIIFVETGLFFGFFLPGDPLLFISGVVLASVNEIHYPFPNENYNLIFWTILFISSTVTGNFVAYWFGYKFNNLFSEEKETWFIKKKHLQNAQQFYDKRGNFTIAIARFLPIIRTFAPIIAGTVKMNLRSFTIYNILGAIVWVSSLMLAGFLLGDNPWVQRNIEYVILAIILIVTAPVIINLFLKKNY